MPRIIPRRGRYTGLDMLAPLVLVALSAMPTVRLGSAELVPSEPLPLGGYTQRSDRAFEPGGEPIGARCVVFESQGMKLAVVSADLLTIPESLVREVRQKLPADVRLFLAATHTHCAPDSQMLNERMNFKVPGIATFNRRWLDWYADGIATMVKGTLESPPITGSYSYRLARLELNRGRRPGTWTESGGSLLEITNETEHRTLLYTYPAHPVFYGSEESKLRGDWPGSLTSRLGGAAVLTGAIGDVSPAAEGGNPAEKIENFVTRTVSALNQARPLELAPPFQISEVKISLAEPKPHPDFAKRYGIPVPIAEELAKKFAPTEASVLVFRLGKFCVVGVPGEPTAELGRRIREEGRRQGFRWTAVVSHVNGWIGYVLGSADYARGGYEATLAFHGPEAGNAVVAASVEAMTQLTGVKSVIEKRP